MLVAMSGSPAKFWGQLSIGKVLLVFLICNVVMQLIGVALREGLGLAWVTAPGAAAGGSFAAVVFVSALARKQQQQTSPPP
jgi:membrane associated rhomboid family serine protease